MTAKNETLDVTIMGRTYKVACRDEEREDLLSSVALLDKKMNEIKSSGKVASAERIAVMAALNIANEFLVSKQSSASVDLESYRRRINSMQGMLDQALDPQEKLL
ncbi:MAG: cell division protein ZapA [Burkholderiales bacterium]